MELTIEQVAQFLGGQVEGDKTTSIRNLAKIEEAGPGDLAFLANPKYEPYLYATSASAVLVGQDFQPEKPTNSALIRVENPYLAFTQLLEEYNRQVKGEKVGVEEPAYIGEGSSIGDKAYRGAFSYVGNNCRIGNNVKIYPHAYVGDNCRIGDGCILYPGAKLHEDCVLGQKVTLHGGAVVGSDGFGFAPRSDGSYQRIPQVGNVVLEDEVSIGANATVDCATMGSTVIHRGAKIDNLVQIAHNVEVGEHTVMAAQCGISGSAKIGAYCTLAGQVGVVGHIEIPNRTTVGAQSGVKKLSPREGQSLLGSPAIDSKENVKIMITMKQLPELKKRVDELEKIVLNSPSTD